MDRQAATKLLESTFGNSFSAERFSIFTKELFNDFELNTKTWEVWKEYKEYIESYQLLGSYKQGKNVIDVLIIKLKKSTSIERARTMQRNFVAKYLNNAEKDAAFVAFYYEGDPDWRFSFVKMEYHLKENEEGKIKLEKELTPVKRYSFLVGKNEPNFTCKRQFLELIMEEEKQPSLENIEAAFSIEKVTKEFFEEYRELYLELEESLNKVITNNSRIKKEFEEKGITSVDFAKKLLGQIVFIYFLQKKGWLGIQKNDKNDFQPWGAGPKDFLRKLFNKEIVPYDNFFNDILEPLFYEALANNRTANDDYYSRFNCKIPFLNGGLFEPIEEYDWVKTDILLDNSIFERILNTFGRYNFTIKEDEPLEKEVAIDPEMLGKVFENLLEIKDRKSKGSYYTPREIVHYMCQQSLISYLETNTSIVREDLAKFVQFGEFTNAQDERQLIRIKEINDEITHFPESAKKFKKELENCLNTLTLPNSIILYKHEIDLLLKNVKIVDPAVGSGAFPVGMMIEIVKARSVLTPFLSVQEQKTRTDYNLKRETIENCLYGVDIESSAVDIAKLRFWLSLIVDELDMKNIKPLPNLDHKIMVGNSLLEDFEGVKLFDEQLLGKSQKTNMKEIEWINDQINILYLELGEINRGVKKLGVKRINEIKKNLKRLEIKKKMLLSEKKDANLQGTLLTDRIKRSMIKLSELKKLQKQFFNEQNRELKRKYREDIEKIEWELITETLKEQGNDTAMKKLRDYKKSRSKPFFLWKLYFAEVFQKENPGFDIVIANPPYVRQEEIKEIKNSLKTNYKIYSATADLYTYFYEKGINILKESGTLTFITSNKFMRARYGIHLRNFVKGNTAIRQIVDFGNKHVFEAITNTAVIITKKGYIKNNMVWIDDNIAKQGISKVEQDQLNEDAWTLADPDVLELKDRMEKRGILLKNWDIEINRGLLTGLNEAFIIDNKTKEKLCHEDPKNEKIIKPIIRGRDIDKYFYRWSGLWAIFLPWHFPLHNDESIKAASLKAEEIFKTEYMSIYKHLTQYKMALESRNKDETGIRYEWYVLQRWASAYYQNFAKEKIIWIELTDENRFAYSKKEELILAGAFLMTGKSLKYLLAFLNSKICKFYFNLICNSSGMATIQWKKFAIERIPIPKMDEKQQKPFENLVNQILAITENIDYFKDPEKQKKVIEIENEIDLLFYKLYLLNEKEIKIVEAKLN